MTAIQPAPTVLLVDDDKDVLLIHKRFLEKMDYRVVVANNGLEALAEFRKEPARFDMLISDFQMPGMDGLSLVSEVRKLCRDISILIVSGYVDDALIEGLRNHEVLVASKPMMFGAFEDLVIAMTGA